MGTSYVRLPPIIAMGFVISIAFGPNAGSAQTATSNASPRSHGAAHRILVIGDSTAAGTGAGPESSIAGRLAADFPTARVDNRGVDGARTHDTLGQLLADHGPRPRMLVIMTGGNDIIQLAPAASIERDFDALLRVAVKRADHVVLITSGNLRNAPRLMWPANAVLGWRSRVSHDVVSRAVAAYPIIHVSMYRPTEEDPFGQEPARYYSSDGIHPSAHGYGLWYATFRLAAPIAEWLNDGKQ